MPKLRCNNIIEAGVTVKMEIVRSSLQVHGKDQPHQPEIVIAVQVADKNVIDPVITYLKPHELHLYRFTAVDQKMPVLNFDELCRGMSSISG